MLSIGIDISSNNITAVELLNSRREMMIKTAANFEISAESIKRGELQEPAILSNALREAWKKYRISGRNVFIGLSNLKAIIKEVELPLTVREEINNSLKYQINDFIPIPKDNILYDYYIMEKTESSSKIMLVGAMKSMVMNVIDAIKGAGLIAQAIDLNCFSLFRTLETVYDLANNKKTFCAVNIGREISIIEIVENDILKFPRLLSNSASTFIENIEKAAVLDPELSKNIIYDFDFDSLLKTSVNINEHGPGSDLPGNAGENMENKSDMAAMEETLNKAGTVQSKSADKTKDMPGSAIIDKTMGDTADNIIDEIKMSIEHYQQENPESKIERIVISGENIKNIEKYIEEKTNYKVERLDISNKFSMGLIDKNAIYNNIDRNQILNPLAIGMALRGMG